MKSNRTSVPVQRHLGEGKGAKVKVTVSRPELCRCGRKAIANGLCDMHHPDV